MKLTWLGHACFAVEQEGYRILLDPYTGVEGYPPLAETASRAADREQRARWEAKGGYTVTRKVRMTIVREGGEHQEPRLPVHKILCSHGHFDHNAVDQAEVVPFDGPCPFTIRTVETFHDDQGGALRGPNTIHILSAGGVTIAHLGDLGHPLSPEQLAAVGPLDAVLIPVGGTYTVDGGQGPLRGPSPQVRRSHALPPRPLRPAQRGGGGGLPVPVGRGGNPSAGGPGPGGGRNRPGRGRSPILRGGVICTVICSLTWTGP